MSSAANPRDEQTFAIIGAAMTVHRELGCGFLEPIYQDAMEREFEFQHIPFEREKRLPVFYRGKPLEDWISVWNRDFLWSDGLHCIPAVQCGTCFRWGDSACSPLRNFKFVGS